MSRVIGVVVCGFTLAACSGSTLDFLKTPDFLKSSPATTTLRFESVPSGAEVKVSGQTCRTPCELTRVGSSARRQQLNNDTPIAAANSSGAVPTEVTTSSEPVPTRASTYGAV